MTREIFKFSQEYISNLAGTTPGHVSLIEAGKRDARPEFIDLLCKIYKVPQHYWYLESGHGKYIEKKQLLKTFEALLKEDEILEYHIERSIEVRVWLSSSKYADVERRARIQDAIKALTLEVEPIVCYLEVDERRPSLAAQETEEE